MMRRGLGHVPGVARGAYPAAFAGEGDQEIVCAVLATGTRKAVSQDGASQVAEELPSHVL
jgi:hypothetical protein